MKTASRSTLAISAPRPGALTGTSPRCSRRRAPRGKTSCAQPATCATSSVTTRPSTKSARRSTGSRSSIRCRPRPEYRPSSAGRNCWWKLKPSRCSGGAWKRSSAMPPLGRDTAPSRSRLGTLLLLLLAAAPASWAQCECGAHPPGPPPNRVHEPYADEPEDMRPFSRFTKPYHEHYTKLVEYNGAAQDVPAPNLADLSEVRIGFLGPIREHIDEVLGNAMLHGASLAIDEANARGGYCGKPFRLMVHNDAAVWGASSNEIVKMCYDEQVWAMLGSISGDSTHIALRVALRSEVPIVNSAATDPTIPETVIPWYFTVIQDDRVQGYTRAHRHHAGERPLRALWRAEIPGRLPPPGAPRGDRAKVHARGHGLRPPVAGDPRFARGRRGAVGGRDPRRHDPEADARHGTHTAGVRQLPRAG